MESRFWHKRWEQGEIGFHENHVNPLLVAHFSKLGLLAGDRIFLPLCGKTRDISWLLKGGFRVVGVELSEIAVGQLFAELTLEPTVSTVGKFQHYSAKNIDIYQGDIFAISQQLILPVDAIYDRAALVALPDAMRINYAKLLLRIAPNARQLLITMEYDQSLMTGPPFSIGEQALVALYGSEYKINSIATENVAGGFKGQYLATNLVWLLIKL